MSAGSIRSLISSFHLHTRRTRTKQETSYLMQVRQFFSRSWGQITLGKNIGISKDFAKTQKFWHLELNYSNSLMKPKFAHFNRHSKQNTTRGAEL